MSLRRLTVELAIPEPLTDEQKKLWDDTLSNIKKLKGESKIINTGKANEEQTVTAKWHICRHDEGKLCDPDVNI